MRKNFDFYAYNSITDGFFSVNGVNYFYGEDYRNVKRFREYKEVGFNVLLLQYPNCFGETACAPSAVKCMEQAVKAGIKKIIVADTRLRDLCGEKNLVGETGKFKTDEELSEYLRVCVGDYRNIKGFYGIQLRDEPYWYHLESYGKVYKALKAILPTAYLQCNLFPVAGKEWLAEESRDDVEAYKDYLEKFLYYTDSDGICFDEYPFRREYLLGGYTLITYQTVANVCRKHNVEMRAVLQSFSFINGKNLIHRRVTERDMLWQTNLAMGFGVVEFSFYTYFPKVNFNIGGENDCIDGACFINRDGTKTRLYGFTKKIIKTMKGFSKTALAFSFKNSYLAFEKGKTSKDFCQTEFAEQNINCPVAVEIEYGVALITELTNKNKSLFMIENFGNVKDEICGKGPAELKIKLNGKIRAAFLNGKKTRIKAVNGLVSRRLHVGDALYFIV